MSIERLSVRMDSSLKKSIVKASKQACLSLSDYSRIAIVEKLEKDAGLDETLMLDHLSKISRKTSQLQNELDIFFNFFCYFTQSYYSHTQSVPDSHKNDAYLRGQHRFKKLFDSFANNLQNDPQAYFDLLTTRCESRN